MDCELIDEVEHAQGRHDLSQRGNLTLLSFALTKHQVAFFAVNYGPIHGTHVRSWILKK